MRLSVDPGPMPISPTNPFKGRVEEAMSLLGTTLTLPGIAGFVLTIGAAVDANVLINERIREEIRRGRRLLDAVETGYREAMRAIFDANVTHVISASIMAYFGSGPVRGFAVVLLIGVVTSVFTAVYFTRMAKDVRVVLRTADELDAVVRANPFPDKRSNSVQAFFMNEKPPADLLDTVRNQAADERVAAGAREVYVAYGEKDIGRSRMRIPVAEAGTARNMNTVAKLAELARELQ